MSYSILHFLELSLPLYCTFDDKHVIYSDGQYEKRYDLSTDHSETYSHIAY